MKGGFDWCPARKRTESPNLWKTISYEEELVYEFKDIMIGFAFQKDHLGEHKESVLGLCEAEERWERRGT
jgi:hypothetical protein